MQDEGSPYAPTAPVEFHCEDDSLWNILIYGMERVCDDIANDCVTCSCVIDSAFWLLTKPEQCSEACRLFIHLLTGVTIVYVARGEAVTRLSWVTSGIVWRARKFAGAGCHVDPAAQACAADISIVWARANVVLLCDAGCHDVGVSGTAAIPRVSPCGAGSEPRKCFISSRRVP